MKAKKGDWVQVYKRILEPGERAPQVPDDTKKVPLEAWINGYLLNEEAEIGEEVEIRTLADRIERGILSEINPKFKHDFGEPIPDVVEAVLRVRSLLFEGSDENA